MDKPYANRTWQQGDVVSLPVMKQLSPRTKITSFSLAAVESWADDSGVLKERRNVFVIETLGRDAEYVYREARLGRMVTVDGYLRSDVVKGQNVIRIRTFHIHIWDYDHANRTPGSSDPDGAPAA